MQNFVKITLVLTEISTEMTEILIGIVNYDGQCISKAYLGFLPSNILYATYNEGLLHIIGTPDSRHSNPSNLNLEILVLQNILKRESKKNPAGDNF